MVRTALFLAAVFVLYIGGFIYDEVGPLLYAVILAIIASSPLLLKFSFWKKLLFMIPLIVLRVIGKVLLSVFGKNALSKLLARYGLLEKRFNKTLENAMLARDRALTRWKRTSVKSQAYLLLIFLPVAIVIFLLALVIKFIRFRFLQFLVEKLMQTYLMRWTIKSKSVEQGDKIDLAPPIDDESLNNHQKINGSDSIPLDSDRVGSDIQNCTDRGSGASDSGTKDRIVKK